MLADKDHSDARVRDLPNPIGQFQQAIDEFEDWLVRAADKRSICPYRQRDPTGVSDDQVGRGASGYLPACDDAGLALSLLGPSLGRVQHNHCSFYGSPCSAERIAPLLLYAWESASITRRYLLHNCPQASKYSSPAWVM